ncbi:anti-sigma factor, partial [bacterium CG17_big_fil_post_rev_8_21_14_2_50_64_8]
MNHVTSRLGALLAEELPDHEAAAVRAHLDSCPSCRAEHER